MMAKIREEKITYIYDSFATSTLIKFFPPLPKISRIWLVRRVKMSFSRGNSETFYQLEKFEHMSSPGLEEINCTEENCQKNIIYVDFFTNRRILAKLS